MNRDFQKEPLEPSGGVPASARLFWEKNGAGFVIYWDGLLNTPRYVSPRRRLMIASGLEIAGPYTAGRPVRGGLPQSRPDPAETDSRMVSWFLETGLCPEERSAEVPNREIPYCPIEEGGSTAGAPRDPQALRFRGLLRDPALDRLHPV